MVSPVTRRWCEGDENCHPWQNKHSVNIQLNKHSSTQMASDIVANEVRVFIVITSQPSVGDENWSSTANTVTQPASKQAQAQTAYQQSLHPWQKHQHVTVQGKWCPNQCCACWGEVVCVKGVAEKPRGA